MADNVEFNITEAHDRTKEGLGHLDSAEKLAKKARNKARPQGSFGVAGGDLAADASCTG